MRFDVVVGNPPYQESDGGSKASAMPVYHYFVELGLKVAQQTCLIMPSRWYVGGKGLNDFRDKMLHSPNMKILIDFPNPADVFPGTNIRGGVCVLLLDKQYDSDKLLTRVETFEGGQVIADTRRHLAAKGLSVFIRDNKALEIISNVTDVSGTDSLADHISPRKPFGLGGTFVHDKKFVKSAVGLLRPIKCYGKDSIGFMERSNVLAHSEWIDSWKVLTARANNIGTELNDDNLNTIIAEPESVCTETYILLGADLELDEVSANNLAKYTKTRFVRYMHSLAKSSQDASRQTYRYVPIQDFTNGSDIDWSGDVQSIDRCLFKKYNLTEENIATIVAKIKSM
ncbi:Eco57I restriction-modification methylase domain-containing protein [Lacticaseibacillus chiayiensis]|uniref:Eco57I restriction-modification methylase domain-containing protein n=1 Tax=Lactobacillaceae TaxID=33958 RepID=UPI001BCC8125|nr:Eco57I restriction-modification methylase domain-containing protein [Lacticaseibacillus chiayiensis]QVI35212.1 Eco57I restriction-modification methylase domain-containing protein [Lacticaseibacillus chiayiensis]